MSEVLGPVMLVVCAVSLAPLLWEICDRRATVARLAPPSDSRRAPPAHPRAAATADLTAFLSAVARALRAGSSPAQAIVAAPPTCNEVVLLQDQLRSGDNMDHSLDSPHPHVRILRACMHGGILSTDALDAAIADERFRVRTDNDTKVAVAQARRSARVLSVLPFAFLALVITTSRSVRANILSPALCSTVAVGIVLNVLGRKWLAVLVARATRPDPSLSLAATIAATCAVHLSAGGSITGCFDTLSPVHLRCAEVATLLRSGHLLSDSLQPLHHIAPQVAGTIIDAHRDGLPVVGAMVRLADDLKRASAAHIQSRIAEVPVRSTTPLVLCVLPSFLLIAVAPLALAALAGLSMPNL